MHNENKINIPDKDGFLSFLEALEFFNNTFFLSDELDSSVDVQTFGKISDLDYAKEMISWPGLLKPQKESLKNLIKSLDVYESSSYDVNTEYQKWESLKQYTKAAYESFLDNFLTEEEKRQIYSDRRVRGLKILKEIGYPGIEVLET